MLEITAQRGLKQEFLDEFNAVTLDTTWSCSQALRRGERVIIEDVESDPAYAPYRLIAASAGYRAVQTTPLLGYSGELLGMLSTHYREPHRPAVRDLRILDLYARYAADVIERPRHPYTRALVSAIPTPNPDIERTRQRIVLAGDPPSPIEPPAGCTFHPRCPFAQERCTKIVPPLFSAGPLREAACIRLDEI